MVFGRACTAKFLLKLQHGTPASSQRVYCEAAERPDDSDSRTLLVDVHLIVNITHLSQVAVDYSNRFSESFQSQA
ncbi:hypothetical protein BaRGS_00000300, partial [Batillaria attramentaria]